jgi:hypothetical protein
MICCCAGAIGGLGTNLVSRNKNVDATVCAGGGNVGPSSIFVAIGKINAPRAIALCNYGSAARFVFVIAWYSLLPSSSWTGWQTFRAAVSKACRT